METDTFKSNVERFKVIQETIDNGFSLRYDDCKFLLDYTNKLMDIYSSICIDHPCFADPDFIQIEDMDEVMDCDDPFLDAG